MDSFELNKIAGAVLGSALLLMVIGEIGNFLVHPHELDKPVIELAASEEAAPAQAAEAKPEVPLAQLLAEASEKKGAAQAKKCHACHDFTKGGPNKIGPNLYGVIGRDIASHEGFSYSSELQSLEGNWDYDKLFHFLANPKKYAPGTKMAFAGLKRPKQRADVLLFLRTLADTPPPLPTK